MSGASAVLGVDSVTVRYGAVEALHSVTLSVEAGGVTCLLGDNGAGKSTLVKVLTGVVAPAEGSLVLDGRPVRFRSPREARAAGIAVVFQDLALHPLMSAWRNYVLGSEPVRGWGPLRRIDRGTSGAQAASALEDFGIAGLDVERPVGSLSGGERQVLAIARALRARPRVLILDEPTAALGVGRREQVLEAVRRVTAQGVGVVFVTHDPADAARMADRYVVLDRGRVVEAGTGPADAAALRRRMAGAREPGRGGSGSRDGG